MGPGKAEDGGGCCGHRSVYRRQSGSETHKGRRKTCKLAATLYSTRLRSLALKTAIDQLYLTVRVLAANAISGHRFTALELVRHDVFRGC